MFLFFFFPTEERYRCLTYRTREITRLALNSNPTNPLNSQLLSKNLQKSPVTFPTAGNDIPLVKHCLKKNTNGNNKKKNSRNYIIFKSSHQQTRFCGLHKVLIPIHKQRDV